MNRHLFFTITACVITGLTPLIFTEKDNILMFISIALAALFLQVYWRDILVQALVVRGRLAVKSGDYKKLRDSYEKIHRLLPRSFAGKMAMGVIHSLQENWAHAESYFRQAIYYKPGNLYACLNLSVVLLRREHYHEVIKLLKALIFAYPGSIQAYKLLAEACYGLGRLHEACHYLKAARLIDCRDPEIQRFISIIEQEIDQAA
ncbi:tetratricopeptide repeat protein [Desulfoscipio geothermicus]|uniref:Anaphase-promoting complex, cyclosome, subunit 3 n=1 Tax=Desulfoscipio geothermicus DSM 3669 TaxID=1121426 RepID=A0A1I6E083_9FIRM|nr:tetratricopeptide repeat protein [Desulfoscipio geothermicus]SFR11037.1 Anaphase-promoting complex, cyclosome, subunit 3 [Desulfoscipio geothermicus DSM 3669]